MRVVVVSCFAYRDAWNPCLSLIDKFWPELQAAVNIAFDMNGESWCEVVAKYAKANPSEPILMLQEDFFLNAPVRQDLIEHALSQMQRWNAGMIRLYPCPGANAWYDDDRVGFVAPASDYSISCQASIWQPDYLYQIASQCDTPQSFELKGSKIAANLDRHLLAWRRDAQPWPLQYFCSAISRGKWNPDAVEFCRQQGVEVDLSLRPVA